MRRHSMTKGAKGQVVQIIGTVVDLEFPAEALPEIYNALEVDAGGGRRLIAEPQQHRAKTGGRARAMDSTDGLSRGPPAVDTGEPISIPVGEPCLGRLFNVLGEPIDNL